MTANKDKQIIQKQKELIKYIKHILDGWEYFSPTVEKMESELAALESEPEDGYCNCNSEVIGSYANCPIHSPDIDISKL